MKVLALVSGGNRLTDGTFHSYARVRAHYLIAELKKLGVEVLLCDSGPVHKTLEESAEYWEDESLPTADHCLCFDSNTILSRTWMGRFVQRPLYQEWVGVSPLYDSLRTRVSGCIAALRESSVRSGMEDTVFSENPIVLTEKTVQVGMAADGRVFYPCQTDETVVLLDHPNYADPKIRPDDDTTLLLQTFLGHATVRICGLTDVLTLDEKSSLERGRYRSHIPHLKIAEHYNRAHVFCVTHWESTPLSVFEAAMAGALIVARRGYLRQWIVDTLRVVEYEERPDWEEVRKMIDPAASRRMALAYDRYDEIARLIYDHFQSWRGATRF